jgi:two-component system, chemotaxis family, sensor kinase CheA
MNDFSQQDFIENFLEEAADHLQAINRNLLAFEELLPVDMNSARSSVTRINLIRELFRSFHTLKGLAGMVGLGPAEQLSHRMESVLRAVQQMQVPITLKLIDTLLEGTRTLESIVNAVKDQSYIPEISESLKMIEGLLNDESLPEEDRSIFAEKSVEINHSNPRYLEEIPQPTFIHLLESALEQYSEILSNLNEFDRQSILAAHQDGLRFSLVFYTPSSDIAAQGHNVTQIREKLNQAAKIVKAVPIINDSGIRFAFLVASSLPVSCQDLPGTECNDLKTHDWVSRSSTDPLPRASNPDIFLQRSRQTSPTNTVRVELEKLDDLLRLVGELVISRSRLVDQISKIEQFSTDNKARYVLESLEITGEQLNKHLSELRQAVVRARMVPVAEVFSHMSLAVRDLARTTGKEVRLVTIGEKTEIDKMLVERLLDPLLHMVRNAITHGIETPAERRAVGKPSEGKLSLEARLQGDRILIRIQDDGRGIDIDKVRQKAAASGLFAENDDRPLTTAEILSFITRHGFTTVDDVNLGAGRGVGMEVVSQTLKSVGGHLDLETVSGRGTTFTASLPLTLTIFDAILVRSGQETYAIPLYTVEEVIEINPSEIVSVESGELIPYRETFLALINLSRLFHSSQVLSENRLFYGLVGAGNIHKTVLLIDKLIGMQEVVLRSSSDPLIAQPGILGFTELGDGKIILILDIPVILQGGFPENK